MKMGFSTTVWEWYGQDECKRMLAVGEAIRGLEFLAMKSCVQQETIPDCAACEAWSLAMLPLEELLSVCGNGLPSGVRTGVQGVWGLCNELSDAAFHCADRGIFEHGEWSLIRQAAGELLALMEVAELKPFLQELLADCRKVHCN